jgi:hypothetical protein
MNVIYQLIGIAVIANFIVPILVKEGLEQKPFSCEKCIAFWIAMFFLTFNKYSITDTVLFSFISYQISGLIYKYL